MANISDSVKQWLEDIENDQYCETTPVEMGCICYDTFRYIWNNEKTNMADFFGKEFAPLNRSMSNIYSQVDRIKNFRSNETNTNIKYDAEKIKELRLQGLNSKEICEKLGYPADKSRSLTSNRGWIEAGKILKDRKCTENTEFVQKSVKSDAEIVQTDRQNSVQKNTESVQKQTESTDSVQNSSGFDF